jgi:hypothetical protein
LASALGARCPYVPDREARVTEDEATLPPNEAAQKGLVAGSAATDAEELGKERRRKGLSPIGHVGAAKEVDGHPLEWVPVVEPEVLPTGDRDLGYASGMAPVASLSVLGDDPACTHNTWQAQHVVQCCEPLGGVDGVVVGEGDDLAVCGFQPCPECGEEAGGDDHNADDALFV